MNIGNYIDHTLLKADATLGEIERLCVEAETHQFFSVCVNPVWVKTAKKFLSHSKVKVCTVIGFPLGASTSETKVFETKEAIVNGADEIDMVMNIGALKSGNTEQVASEIEAIVSASAGRALVKVIIETSLLTDDEKKTACQLVESARADFVKTSTGFSTSGATVEDIKLIKSIVDERMGIKASGGIRDYTFAEKLIRSGATRIGASASVAIINGRKS
ncbi:deoxyribose-phosphate aldolase [Pueribacillus sp. YX66]|uniref:deoxyribose-phosphate aldolase n=1 Tax=Pueribacillus sp. YX66 TaxID=3229242 RepID=UPI00358D416B